MKQASIAVRRLGANSLALLREAHASIRNHSKLPVNAAVARNEVVRGLSANRQQRKRNVWVASAGVKCKWKRMPVVDQFEESTSLRG
jgi:hypothetical protein